MTTRMYPPRFVALGATIVLMASCTLTATQEPTPAPTPLLPPPTPVTVEMQELNGSGISGTVNVSQLAGMVNIAFRLEGMPEESEMSAYVHLGSCAELGQARFPLLNVVNGRSETALSMPMEKFMSMLPLAIMVHPSVEATDQNVACGDIMTAGEVSTPTETPTLPETTPNDDSSTNTTAPTEAPTTPESDSAPETSY